MATYKIKGKRHLRKYTAPALTPVYGVSGAVATMAANLCDCPWEPVEPLDACFPSHAEASLDGNVAARDFFDAAAFCAGHADGLHRVYGQAACYVFTLPDEAVGASLTSLSVPVYSDPYNAGGIRLAVHTASTLEIPTDCATARTGLAHVDGVAPRTSSTSESGAQTWTGAHATVTISPASAITLQKYLMVVVALESFVGRAGYAEGAAYAMNAFSITTSAAISADGWTDGNTTPIDCTADTPQSAQPIELLAGGDSPTWIQPLPTRNAGDAIPDATGAAASEDVFTSMRGGGMENSRNQIILAIPTSEAQESAGAAGYKGRFRVTISGTAIQKVQFLADISLYPDNWIDLSQTGSRSGGYAVYQWSVSQSDGSGSQATLICKVAAVQGATDGARYSLMIDTYNTTLYGNRAPSGGALPYVFSTTSYAVEGSAEFTAFTNVPDYCLWLRFSNDAPMAADRCSSPDVAARQNAAVAIEETETGAAWTVTIASIPYSVTKSGTSVTMKSADGTETLGRWTLGATGFFDVSVELWMNNESLRVYGAAATLGDFSHAVAAFEGGTQPSQAEVLGRLVRNSRRSVGEMMYLHPVTAALADELDVLRPVPRFYRESSAPSQTTCQPGLSVWYKRPSLGSGYDRKFAYKSGIVTVTSVVRPVFLQYTLLAVRAPAVGEGMSLVLTNVGPGDVVNGFDLRFAVWRSPAEEWDGSNNVALSAIVAAPCLYRADGADDVSWSVDCGGAAFPFGTRTVHAHRLGVSPVVSGAIAANQEIAVPLSGALEEGDVLIIAPVVLGFADGVGAGSVYFGRQSDPASATTGWARYATDLGWFPKITLEP